jgi:hypothetical protein
MVSTLLSVITIDIIEIKIHISYSENHDLTLMLGFYYFYVLLLTTHAHIIVKDAFKRHRKYHHSSQRPEKLFFHTNVGRYYFTCLCTPIAVMVLVYLNIIGSITICLKDQVSYKI